MKPIMQVENYPSGDCFRACVCSIFELPLEAVPNFQEGEGRNFDELLYEWNEKNDYRLVSVPWEDSLLEVFRDCIVIAHGKSPGKDYKHAVVWRNGEIIHDPHPLKIGIEKVELITIAVKKDVL